MDEPQAPSNIVINGQEYSPEDAQALIETGSRVRAWEQEKNTKFDSVLPEYTKLTQEKSSWAQEKEQLTKELADFKAKQAAQVETPADERAAKEAARKLGILLNEDVQGKYLTKDELENWYSEKRKLESATDKLLSEAKDLEKELDGSDGRPKFKTRNVLAYAQAYDIADLREAYEKMNEDELSSWGEQQKTLKKGSSLKTLSGGGKKTPQEVRPTKDNVRDMLHEALSGVF